MSFNKPLFRVLLLVFGALGISIGFSAGQDVAARTSDLEVPKRQQLERTASKIAGLTRGDYVELNDDKGTLLYVSATLPGENPMISTVDAVGRLGVIRPVHRLAPHVRRVIIAKQQDEIAAIRERFLAQGME